MLNNQQLLFLQTLFGTFTGHAISISVKTIKDLSPVKLTVYPSNQMIAWKIDQPYGEGLWDTWSTVEDIKNTFIKHGLMEGIYAT